MAPDVCALNADELLQVKDGQVTFNHLHSIVASLQAAGIKVLIVASMPDVLDRLQAAERWALLQPPLVYTCCHVLQRANPFIDWITIAFTYRCWLLGGGSDLTSFMDDWCVPLLARQWLGRVAPSCHVKLDLETAVLGRVQLPSRISAMLQSQRGVAEPFVVPAFAQATDAVTAAKASCHLTRSAASWLGAAGAVAAELPGPLPRAQHDTAAVPAVAAAAAAGMTVGSAPADTARHSCQRCAPAAAAVPEGTTAFSSGATASSCEFWQEVGSDITVEPRAAWFRDEAGKAVLAVECCNVQGWIFSDAGSLAMQYTQNHSVTEEDGSHHINGMVKLYASGWQNDNGGTVVTAVGGPHTGAQGVGLGYNRKARKRGGLIAMAAAVLVRMGAEADAWLADHRANIEFRNFYYRAKLTYIGDGERTTPPGHGAAAAASSPEAAAQKERWASTSGGSWTSPAAAMPPPAASTAPHRPVDARSRAAVYPPGWRPCGATGVMVPPPPPGPGPDNTDDGPPPPPRRSSPPSQMQRQEGTAVVPPPPPPPHQSQTPPGSSLWGGSAAARPENSPQSSVAGASLEAATHTSPWKRKTKATGLKGKTAAVVDNYNCAKPGYLSLSRGQRIVCLYFEPCPGEPTDDYREYIYCESLGPLGSDGSQPGWFPLELVQWDAEV